jgi:hypothetical protein
MTDAYPDIIRDLSENISPDVENFILDSEIVAFEAKTVREEEKFFATQIS